MAHLLQHAPAGSAHTANGRRAAPRAAELAARSPVTQPGFYRGAYHLPMEASRHRLCAPAVGARAPRPLPAAASWQTRGFWSCGGGRTAERLGARRPRGARAHEPGPLGALGLTHVRHRR